MTVPNYPNGVTHDMAEVGAEAFMHAGYRGVALGTTETDDHPVLATPTAIGIALSRAFPAMADRMEGGPRDVLLHPGPIGGNDPTAWAAMSPKHRAQHVHHAAPAYLLGVAVNLRRLNAGHPYANPADMAACSFLAEAVTALARQMERANVVLHRTADAERQARTERQAEAEAATAKRIDAAHEAGRRAARRRPKKPKPRKAGAS